MPIQVASFLLPRNGATWYVLEDKYLKGGLRVCADVAERTAIHAASLKKGMLVVMLDDNKIYQLTNVASKSWVEFKTTPNTPNPLYTHRQDAPADVWTVEHGKECRYFNYSIFDDMGRSMVPDEVTIINDTLVEIKFIAPIAGHCVFAFDFPPPAPDTSLATPVT